MKLFTKNFFPILLVAVVVIFCGCKSLAQRENERHSKDLDEPHAPARL